MEIEGSGCIVKPEITQFFPLSKMPVFRPSGLDLQTLADFAVLILGTRSSRGVPERKEALLTIRSSYSLQHEMGRVFRGRELCHRKSKRRQVDGELAAVV